MPVASCMNHAPFPPQFSSPRRSPPPSSTQSDLERGTHPLEARVPSCVGLPAPARSHPRVRLQLAGVHGPPSSEGEGWGVDEPKQWAGQAAWWARGPGSRLAAQGPAAGAAGAVRLFETRASRLRHVSPPPPQFSQAEAIRNNVELPGH